VFSEGWNLAPQLYQTLGAKEMANHFYGFFGELEVQKGGMGGEFGW